MKVLSGELKGSFYAITSGLLYGLVGYFGLTLINSDISIATAQFWRFLISAIFILPLFIKYYRNGDDYPIDMAKAFLSGAILYSTSAGAYFLGSQYIGTGLSMVIFFTFPAMVMLLSRCIYKFAIPKMYYVAVLLIFIGMIPLANLSELTVNFTGIGFALVGAFLYACYILCSKNINLSPISSTFMISLGCAAACFIFSLFNQEFIFPSTTFQWIHILGFGIISTALPMLFLLRGLKNISPEKASILSVLEPIFVLIFGIILLGEAVSLAQLLGVITILTGAFMTLFNRKSEIVSGKYQPEG